MAHSSPERSLYIGDVDEEDRDDILDDEEEEGEEEGRDVYDSDLSETTSTDGHDSPHAGSRPGSYTTSWPQSYRFFLFFDLLLRIFLSIYWLIG